eukprot:761369-Hanusia_phi.AAC.4
MQMGKLTRRARGCRRRPSARPRPSCCSPLTCRMSEEEEETRRPDESSSRSSESTQLISSLRLTAMAACCRALQTERYASVPLVYFPTRAILT